MSGKWFLLLPLLWSIGYAVGGLLLKRALDGGAGALRIAFINNMFLGLMFLPGWFNLPANAGAAAYGWAMLASLIFFAGQVFTFVAMRTGDVSVFTPILGIKVVFVAIFMVVMKAGPMPGTWWAASVLAAAAVFLLGVSNWKDRKRLGRTVLLAIGSAGSFAFCDILTQTHAPALGATGFAAVMLGTAALASLLMVPFFREPLQAIPRPAWPWTLAGSLVVASQSGGMAYTLGKFGAAPAINVVYSMRGLWSILLVWMVGHWFGNQERNAGTKAMAQRLAGALLLLVAVGLVFSEKA